MPQVKFILEADEAKAVQSFLNVVRAQGKARDSMITLGKATQGAMTTAEQSVDQLRGKLRAAEQQAVSSSSRIAVAQVRNLTQGQRDLFLTQSARQMMRQGGSGSFVAGAQDISFQRFLAAGRIRDDRAFERFIARDRADKRAREAAVSGGAADLVARGMATAGRLRARNAASSAADAAALTAFRARMDAQREQANAALSSTKSTILRIGVGVASVAAAAIRLREEIESQRQAAVERKMASSADVSALRQIAGSQAELDQLMSRVGQARERFGMEEGPAAALIFDLQSAGILSDESMATLTNTRKLGVNAQDLVKAYLVMNENWPGLAGQSQFSLEDIAAKAMTAAGPSAASISSIARASGQMSASWRRIGGSPSSMLAVLGTLSNTFKSTDIAAERGGALASFLAEKIAQGKINFTGRQPLGDLELIGALPELASQGRLLGDAGKPVSVDAFLTSTEAAGAYGIIKDAMPRIDALTRQIYESRGGEKSIVRTRAALNIGGTDAAQSLRNQQQATQKTIEVLEAAVTARRDAVREAVYRETYRQSPWSAQLGRFTDRVENVIHDPIESDALHPASIGQYIERSQWPGFAQDIANRMTDAELGRRLSLDTKAKKWEYTPAGGQQYAAFEEQFLKLEQQRRSGGDATGIQQAISTLIQALNNNTAAMTKPAAVTIPPAAAPNRGR